MRASPIPFSPRGCQVARVLGEQMLRCQLEPVGRAPQGGVLDVRRQLGDQIGRGPRPAREVLY